MSLQAGSEQTLRLPSKVDPFVVRYSGATPTSMRGSSPTARITPMVSECPDPLPLHHVRNAFIYLYLTLILLVVLLEKLSNRKAV